jgi:hypothetical protein
VQLLSGAFLVVFAATFVVEVAVVVRGSRTFSCEGLVRGALVPAVVLGLMINLLLMLWLIFILTLLM